jgi:hypothetical protein
MRDTAWACRSGFLLPADFHRGGVFNRMPALSNWGGVVFEMKV